MIFSVVARSFPAKVILCALIAAASAAGQPWNASVEVPGNLRPPAGHRAYLMLSAVGTQNYICLPSGWTFIGPQATLFISVPWINGSVQRHIGTHYLTPNPDEAGVLRPLWHSATDNSIVRAKQVEASSDPAFVRPDAIPWLLLEKAGTEGTGIMAQTTYVQRVNTTAGLKPTSTCTVGERQFVPYTADYVFYRKSTN